MRLGIQSTDIRASTAKTYSSTQANSSVSPVKIDWEHARIPSIFPPTSTTKSTISPPKRSTRTNNNSPTKAPLQCSKNDMVFQSLESIQDSKKKAELMEIAKSMQQIEQQKRLLLCRTSHVPVRLVPPVVSQNTTVTQERMTLRAKKTLETDIKELTLCDCGEEIHPLDLRFHQEEECSYREIPCIRPGCQMIFKAKDRVEHEKNDCKFMLKNKKILQEAAMGELQVECTECSQQIQQRFLKRHLRDTCESRFVSCPHKEFGCHEQVRSNELKEHEQTSCVVAKIRAKIAANAVFVNEEIICDWCQSKIKKRHLIDHQEEECPERERPCLNAHNGCREWVPVSKMDDHLRMDCCVTLEREMLAKKAREKNLFIYCRECGKRVKQKHLQKHLQIDCISRLVSCKNLSHGCKAIVRWRDRHLHEDFRSLSKQTRSMLEFYGGNSFILIDNQKILGKNLPPPWTIEFYIWLIDVKTEILQLIQKALIQMENLLFATKEKDNWNRQSSALKKRLQQLKTRRATSKRELRERKSQSGFVGGFHDRVGTDRGFSESSDDGFGENSQFGGETSDRSGGTSEQQQEQDFFLTAKQLGEDFETAEKNIKTNSKKINVSQNWIKIYILEAFRLFQLEIVEKEEEKLKMIEAIYAQTQAFVQDKVLFSREFLDEKELAKLFDLTIWARDLSANTTSSKDSGSNDRIRRRKSSQMLSKRASLIAQQKQQEQEENDDERRRKTPQEKERLQRKLVREISKLDEKIASLNDNMPPELINRSGRHVLLSSSTSCLCLMMKDTGKVGIHHKEDEEEIITFDYFPERNQWLHLVLSASPMDITLYVNGQLKEKKKKKNIHLPIEKMGTMGTFSSSIIIEKEEEEREKKIGGNEKEKEDEDGNESFQGFLQEIRLWKSTRTQEEIQLFAKDILPLGNHITTSNTSATSTTSTTSTTTTTTTTNTLVGYWTLEEGMGEFIDDASLNLPRSACFNTRWIEYTQPIRQRFGLPPTPSLRDKMCCIVNQKLQLLAQRARDRHDLIVSCHQECGEKMHVKLLEFHLRCLCPNRPVVCSEIGCQQIYQLCEKQNHLKNVCTRHLLKEKLAANYKQKEIKEKCILNCGLLIKKRYLTQHYQQECPKRLIVCSYPDCKETIAYENQKKHFEFDCQSKQLANEKRMVQRSRQRQQMKKEQQQSTTTL